MKKQEIYVISDNPTPENPDDKTDLVKVLRSSGRYEWMTKDELAQLNKKKWEEHVQWDKLRRQRDVSFIIAFISVISLFGYISLNTQGMIDRSRPTDIDLAVVSSETKASSESVSSEQSPQQVALIQDRADIDQVQSTPGVIEITESPLAKPAVPVNSKATISLSKQTLTASETAINYSVDNEKTETSVVNDLPIVDTRDNHAEPTIEVIESAQNLVLTELTATETITQETTDSTWNEVSTLQNNQEQEVKQVIQTWAECWSAQDVDCYLASYSDNFLPPNKMSLVSWKDQRQRRISSSKSIQVDISDLTIASSDNDNLSVHFNQSYHSQGYNDLVQKTLIMKKEDGVWKIIKEYLNDS